MLKTGRDVRSREEFTGWVKAHTSDLLRYCRSRVKDDATAEDIVQLTCMSAWGTMDRFARESSPRTWLFAILKHKLADHYRKVYREAAALSGSELENDLLGNDLFERNGHWKRDRSTDADIQAFAEEDEKERLDRALRHCLDLLPPHWRSAIEMKYLLEKDSTAIREALGLSETNYWQQVHRAKLKLRRCIQDRIQHYET